MEELDKLELEEVSSYTELGEDWYKNIPSGSYMHPDQVSIAEKSQLQNMQYRYVRVKLGSKTLAYLYFQILKLQKEHIKLDSPIWQNLAMASINVFKPNLLVCGHLFRHDIQSYYFLDHSLSSYQEAKIIYKSCEKMLAKCGMTAILLKDLSDEYNSYLMNHATRCKAMKEDISMRLNIHPEWNTLDDYIASLKHKYKQRAKKILKKSQDLYTKDFDIEDLDKYKDELSNAYTQLLSRQSVKLGKINISFLKNLLHMNPNFYVYGIFEKDSNRCIGFYSYFEQGTCLDMFYIGLLTDENRKYSLYFNILYWGLKEAIDSGFKSVNYGRTALDPKANIGCSPYFSQNYYRIKNRLLNRITQRAQYKFFENQGEVWESRKPFNTKYYESLNQEPSLVE